jgi:hypothetical protein
MPLEPKARFWMQSRGVVLLGWCIASKSWDQQLISQQHMPTSHAAPTGKYMTAE